MTPNLHPRVAHVTERIRVLAAPRAARRTSTATRGGHGVAQARRDCLHEPRPRCAARLRRPEGQQGHGPPPPSRRLGLQRHALGPCAVCRLSALDCRGGPRGRRDGPVRRRRARDVRRNHPGPRGHGALALLARRDRAGHGHRAFARHVRRGAVPWSVRQIGAGPAPRPLASAPAGVVRAAGPMPTGLPTRRRAKIRQLTRAGASRGRISSRPNPAPTTRPNLHLYGTATATSPHEVMGLTSRGRIRPPARRCARRSRGRRRAGPADHRRRGLVHARGPLVHANPS